MADLANHHATPTFDASGYRQDVMLKALVDAAADGIMMIDPQGLIQMANPAAEKLFGYEAAEMIGHNIQMLMPPMPGNGHDPYRGNDRESGIRKIIGIGREITGKRRDGTPFPMCLSVSEADQDGESFLVGIMHDLTERKRTEQQLTQAQMMETIGRLSGGIAHDFNNLLTVIIGNADLLGENLQGRPDLKHLCDTIVSAGERGAALTRCLLAFSRRQTLRPAAIDCGKLLDDIKDMLRRTVSKDIEISITDDAPSADAYADAAQLESTLLNLALNARDAMPRGGHLHFTIGTVYLDKDYQSTHPEVRPGPYVMIAVTDDGIGMPPEVRAHAFEPFFTTKEVGKGTGLGLSMIYGFVRQSNGHIAIYSEEGRGTTVRLYLPAAEGAAAPMPEAIKPAATGAASSM